MEKWQCQYLAFFSGIKKIQNGFTIQAVNCVLELTEVNSVKKKRALVLWESPKFCKQRVYQDNIHKIKKKNQ